MLAARLFATRSITRIPYLLRAVRLPRFFSVEDAVVRNVLANHKEKAGPWATMLVSQAAVNQCLAGKAQF